MKRFRFLAFLFVVFFVVNSYGLNKNYIENRIKNVQEAIKKKKEGYLKLRAQYVTLMKKKQKTEAGIGTLRTKIKKNRTKLARLNKKIKLLKKNIGSISRQLITQKNELYREFNQYYQYSSTSGYYKKGVWYEYMNSFIIKYMEDKINQYVSKRAYLKDRLDVWRMYVEKKQRILDKIDSQQRKLKKQAYSLSLLTKEALKKKSDYLAEIKSLSSEQNRLQEILQNIIEVEKRKKALLELKKRKREQNKRKQSHIVNIPQKEKISSYSLKKSFGGLLSPPVRGKVVDTFGKKYDTVFKVYTRNDGIDIRAKQGSCVRAVYAGKVDYVGSLPGYGGVVILNHLNGYYTVYGGVEPKVKEGESVKMQECIGSMQKDKLHFELRRHSKAVNPLRLLNRRFLR